jgi:hypothetical protein
MTKHKIDKIIDSLNHKIGKLLGAKHNNLSIKPTNNLKFSIIMLIVCLVLWLTTGFYYISDSEFGLILYNGKIHDIVRGVKIGLTLPYPFSSVIGISATNTPNMNLTQIIPNNYNTLSKNLVPFRINLEFNYQVINPRKVFNQILNDDNMDTLVSYQLQNNLHNYIANLSASELTNINLTIMAQDIKQNLNKNLNNYGLQINKLNIIEFESIANNVNNSNNNTQPSIKDTSIPLIATQLLAQANQFSLDTLQQTNLDVEQFNHLLNEYHKAPNAIIEQMYYDTLAQIPMKKVTYPLLDLDLKQFMVLVNKESASPIDNNTESDTRNFNRDVQRERNFNANGGI